MAKGDEDPWSACHGNSLVSANSSCCRRLLQIKSARNIAPRRKRDPMAIPAAAPPDSWEDPFGGLEDGVLDTDCEADPTAPETGVEAAPAKGEGP